MLSRQDGGREIDESTGEGIPDRVARLECRLVQVGLTLYLMPVILIVLAIGGTVVVSAGLAKAASRVLPGHHPRTGGTTSATEQGEKHPRPHLVSRAGRTRVL